MNYINKQSFKCLLGPRSKEINILNNLFLWKVGDKNHFVVENNITLENIEILKEYCPSNFHYMTEANLLVLKQHFKVHKTRGNSVVLDITDLSFRGTKHSSVRHCLNRCNKEGFVLESNYRNFSDVKKCIEEWSDLYTSSYFRDNSGKNAYFYKNNFHEGLISLFVYNEDDLVAFGSLSQPISGYSSYVLGKALFKRHYGLSEFADVELYKLGKDSGIEYVNMGAATKGLIHYKMKFNGYTETHFDGNIS